MGDHLDVTARTRLRRKAERGRYDRATVHAILDEGFVCHLGFTVDGRPAVLPTAYARVGEDLYLHGAAANAALKAAGDAPVCVTVTLVDGVVLARSAFHHSMNYRSVMVFGEATTVDDPDEKRRAVEAIVEHVVPGRTADARGPTAAEVRATRVIRVPIVEASAKVRTGPPIDDEDDLGLAVWAGHVPLALRAGEPVPAPDLAAGVDVPAYARAYRSAAERR
jgi:uncharacterized protein